MRQFECGDVVELRHKNEKMCVDWYDKNNMVICVWFDSISELHRQPFKEENLVLSKYKYLFDLQRKINKING